LIYLDSLRPERGQLVRATTFPPPSAGRFSISGKVHKVNGLPRRSLGEGGSAGLRPGVYPLRENSRNSRQSLFPIRVYLCPSVVQIGFKLALKWLYLALFGFKWVRFLSSKSPFHIDKIRRFLHFKIGFVS